MGVQNVQQLEGSYSFIVLHCIHNYVLTCRTVGWYRQCAVVLSSYGLMFIPIQKKNLFGEDDGHAVFLISPISSYCYDLMKTQSVSLSVSGKSFTAVSLEVPSTW